MVSPDLTGRLDILRKMLIQEKVDADVILGKKYKKELLIIYLIYLIIVVSVGKVCLICLFL